MPLNWGGVTRPWSSAAVIATLVVGGVLVVAFLLWEAKGPRVPILPMSIFRYRTVVGVVRVLSFVPLALTHKCS